MYLVRLNDVTIKVSGQKISIFDVFEDMSPEEENVIISYLVDEGFINPKKEIYVYIESRPFLQSPSRKKARQKKS